MRSPSRRFWLIARLAVMAVLIAAVLAFPSFASLVGHWNWVLGIITGWLWRDAVERLLRRRR